MTNELSPGEMDALVEALYAVLVLVAGADGAVDPKEEKRFAELLVAASQTDEPLHSVIERARATMPGPTSSPSLAHEDAIDRVRAGVRVAEDKLKPEAAERFKDGLYCMGKALAEASGGGFLGLGKRLSHEEQDALVVLAACLGLRAQ